MLVFYGMTIAERLGLGKKRDGLDEEAYIDAAALGAAPWRVPRDILLILILALSVSASFGLGVLAGRESRENGAGKANDGFWIEKLGETPPAPGAPAVEPPSAPIPAKASPAVPAAAAALPGAGQVVASKTGTKYYLPWCGTVSRIKEENKVWFASKAEAEKAGYEPAKNCKGL